MEEAGSHLTLDAAALMKAAAAETELDDYGAADFVARLDLLCQAMRDEAGLNGAGILQQHTFILGLLKNRLLVEDLVRRHPEILEERDHRPHRHLRPAPDRDHAPAQLDIGGSCPAFAPLLGEPRAGPGRP